ncbi:Protein of uncharacterised function (DUF3800) [Clostridium paraputrificum]|uniref:DUF3800 domain-containing protein n=1 Tax=Clostridium paraputrificum TaxID=29363 RepID=UPI0006C63ED1|nr:DUF3800 domain-containing protein [Clostridium paraputrificum]MDY4720675.1 DUF3800 domain-containing protein [Clostridium paraputrificum]CUQ45865.1 Protein of uncharacterised function (DUF3800) [Clostridium paraputrificum]
MKRLIVYCDESIKKGKFYSNFYGGALIDEKNSDFIIKELEAKKQEIGLRGELKWTNVSAQTLDQYIDFIDKYFDFIKNNLIKLRIMFKQEYYKTKGLTEEQEEKEFYILYYHFLKLAFGFQYCNPTGENVRLKIYLDKLPNKRKENEKFKSDMIYLQETDIFKTANISITDEDITDVDSKKHVIMQGMDIILGAIKFRLNEEHKIIPEGKKRRGKKTIAKEMLYKNIRARIVEIYPNFNIGVSTGHKNGPEDRWKNPYRHWNFISNNSEIDPSKSKK